VVLFAAGLAIGPPPTSAAGEREVPEPLEVRLTDTGFSPSSATLSVGQTLVVENSASGPRPLVTTDGSIDAGTVAVGERLVTAFPTLGSRQLTDGPPPGGHTLAVTVGLLELEAQPSSPASTGIPELVPESVPVDDHPTLGVQVGRNRILITFTPTGTVAQAHQALDAGGLTIVGGFRQLGVLVAEVAPVDDLAERLTAMEDALDSVRGLPGIASAAFDMVLDNQSSLPRPASPDPGPTGLDYAWDGYVDPAGVPRGVGGNWGLEASRFPQAWNLLDDLRERTGRGERLADTLVLDDGFFMDHPDLAGATLHQPCVSTASLTHCSVNPFDQTVGRTGANHGTGTAGILGAAFDRGAPGSATSSGTVGANPAAKLHVQPWLEDWPLSQTGTITTLSLIATIQMVLDNKATRYPRLRTINVSGTPVFFTNKGEDWMTAWAGKTCGPADDDDGGQPGPGWGPCSPDNEDGFIQHFRALARIYVGAADALAANNILFVHAGGNESAILCTVMPKPTTCPQVITLQSRSINPFSQVEFQSGNASPFLNVEAYQKDLTRPAYSNLGDINAPADENIVPAATAGGVYGYGTFNGTSAAAPYVAALASLLTSYHPASNWRQVKDIIVGTARHDTTGGQAPRIDAYAALLAMPGAVDTLLDVNDASPDGVRRVIYDDFGVAVGLDTVSTKPGNGARFSAPDHKVDLRDFRRYRDAFLNICATTVISGCPPVGFIGLDGAATHPKKDANQDGCFLGGPVASCPSEMIYARYDFNGDGTLMQKSANLALNADGTPAAFGQTFPMSDLDVLRSRWPANPESDPVGTGGWTAADLPDLMSSADVEVRLDPLWAQGATEAEIETFTVQGAAPKRTIVPLGLPDDRRVISVPVDDLGGTSPDLVQVRVTAEVPNETEPRVFLSEPLPAKAGSDLVVVPCIDQLTFSSPLTSVIGGQSTLLTATLRDCSGVAVAGREIDFAITEGPNGAELLKLTGTTDVNGDVSTTFKMPATGFGPAKVRASATVALQGEPLSRTLVLNGRQDVAIHFRSRQTVLEYERRSTNDWGPGKDDCDGDVDRAQPVVEFNCFETVQTLGDLRWLANNHPPDYRYDIDPGFPVLEREGTITQNGNGGAIVTERARLYGVRDGEIVWNQIELDTATKEWAPDNPGDLRQRRYDSSSYIQGQERVLDGEMCQAGDPWLGYFQEPCSLDPVDVTPSPEVTWEVPDVTFESTPDGVMIKGLEGLSTGVGLDQRIGSTTSGVLVDARPLHPDAPIGLWGLLEDHPTDFNVGPRSDGSAFKFGADLDEPLLLRDDGTGGFSGHDYCGVVDRDLATGEGYWSDADPVLADGWRDLDDMHPTREAGDRAAPKQSGHIEVQYEMAITAGGTGTPDLTAPCASEDPPVDIGWLPSPVDEGTPVTLFDFSEYADGATSHQWDFGDGATSDQHSPIHTFADSLTYPVRMEVVAAGGSIHDSGTVDIEVRNVAPTIALLGVVGTVDAPRLKVRLDDPSAVDRTQLEVRVGSPTPGFGQVQPVFVSPPPGPDGPLPGAFEKEISLPANLAPGAYSLTVTVIDKDGGQNKVTLSIGVAAVPPVPDPGAPVPNIAATSAGSPTGDLAVDAEPPPAPVAVPAMVVSASSATTGSPVSVRNASRRGTVQLPASIDPGDGRAPTAIAAGAKSDVSWLAEGSFTLALRTAETDVAAGLDVEVNGPPLPPNVAIGGATSGAVGSRAQATATVTRADGSPIAGATVRFVLGSTTADASTGPDGVARAQIPVAGPPGVVTLAASIPPGDDVEVPFTVTANEVPVANAGGPYTVGPDASLNLAASATDGDAGEQALLGWTWDLDGDGEFDDAAGPTPLVGADDVDQLICGGSCEVDDGGEVAVRVIDPKGAAGEARADVSLIRDFGLHLSPPSATIVPGSATSFSVSVFSEDGFTDPVALSIVGLPSGVSAAFQPPAVSPGGTSILTVAASSTVGEQAIPIAVRGTSGTLVREANGSVEVEIGLIPQCYGTVEGRITDRGTGVGIEGIHVVGNAPTDANGNFRAEKVPVGPGNTPTSFNSVIQWPDYHAESVRITAACGITTRVDVSLVRQRYGAVVGHVMGVDVDGTPIGPVAGARIGNVVTDADGYYSIPQVVLPKDSSSLPTNYVANAPSGSDYHSSAPQPVTVEADVATQRDFTLVRRCTGSVRVQVIDSRTKRPFPGAIVGLSGLYDPLTSDQYGVAVVTDVGMRGPANGPQTWGIQARTPAGIVPSATALKSITIGSCGAVVPLTLELAIPQEVRGTVAVTVVDEETGLAVPAARVAVVGPTGRIFLPDADEDGQTQGQYLLGVDVPPEGTVYLQAFRDGYWSSTSVSATLRQGQTTEVTVAMLRERSGVIEGTVRDRVTGEPIAGMSVNGPGSVAVTGADGRYRMENVDLGPRNTPRDAQVLASETKYPPDHHWSSAPKTVTVSAEAPATADLFMLPVCAAATVRGRVLNALTGEPLDQVDVYVSGFSGAKTGPDGRFVLSNIRVGDQNQPAQYTVRAAKEGFLTAQKNVTAYCGADIVVDFGRNESATGTFVGRVTDRAGTPLANHQVVTGFGGANRTDFYGRYEIINVPLADDGSPRDWPVTVVPPATSQFGPVTKTARAVAGTPTTLDFVLVDEPNHAPIASDASVSTRTGEAVPIALGGSDLDADPLTFAVATNPTSGTLSGTAPALVYTPNAGFVGDDTFTYTVSDGVATSAPATVTVTVLPQALAPIAAITSEDGFEVDEASTVSLSGLTSTDPDGEVVLYEWDLDGDGMYGDDSGESIGVRLEDDGTMAVGLRVTDDEGLTAATSVVVTWTNAVPYLYAWGPETIVAGDLWEGGLDGRDRGEDELSATVDWDEGAGPEPLELDVDPDSGFVDHALEQTFTVDGEHTVIVELCDDDGGCATEELEVNVDGDTTTTTTTTSTTTTTQPTTTTTTTTTTSTTTTTQPTTTTTQPTTTTTSTTPPTTTTEPTSTTTSSTSTSTSSTTAPEVDPDIDDPTDTSNTSTTSTTAPPSEPDDDPPSGDGSGTAATGDAATVAGASASRTTSGSLPTTGSSAVEGLTMGALVVLVIGLVVLLAARRREGEGGPGDR